MELEYVNEHIGRKIKDLRNRNGLTQQELADRTELTKGFISQLERGQVSPSIVTLLDLIECLGTTASEFFKEAEEEQSRQKAENGLLFCLCCCFHTCNFLFCYALQGYRFHYRTAIVVIRLSRPITTRPEPIKSLLFQILSVRRRRR